MGATPSTEDDVRDFDIGDWLGKAALLKIMKYCFRKQQPKDEEAMKLANEQLEETAALTDLSDRE